MTDAGKVPDCRQTSESDETMISPLNNRKLCDASTTSPISQISTVVDVDFPPQDARYAQTDSEDETEYGDGGYLRVKIGDTFKESRYRVLQKLGWGHFSTVWLCHDYLHNNLCALKIQKSARQYAEAARDEICLLEAINNKRASNDINVLQLIDHFEHSSPDSKHVCLVFEMLGKSLLSFIKRFNYKGAPYTLVKIIGKQILKGLVFIHETCNIIHTDLKPENVLFVSHTDERDEIAAQVRTAAQKFQLKESQIPGTGLEMAFEIGRSYTPRPENAYASGMIKIVDFGNACWENQHFTDDIQTRQYRSPEVILRAGYNSKVDVWSLACVLFELLTGEFLFDPRQGRPNERDEDHLASMIELLGRVPASMLIRGKATYKFFSRTRPGKLRNITSLNPWSLEAVLQEKYKLPTEDAAEFASFLLPMLRFDPEERVSAREALDHPCMRDDKVSMTPVKNRSQKRSSLADNSKQAHGEATAAPNSETSLSSFSKAQK